MIILASGSPRRRELISKIVKEYEVLCPETDEHTIEGEEPSEMVMRLSMEKANAGADLKDGIVIGADTAVALDGLILGKPKDEAEAESMLRTLKGRTHKVYTGVSVVCRERGYEKSFFEASEVTFFDMTDGEIARYIASGEPMDKAGAYGIQDMGSLFIEKINGDYFNIVGLPVARLYRLLRDDFPELFEEGGNEK